MILRAIQLSIILLTGVVAWVPANANSNAISQLEHFFQHTHSLKGQFIQRVYKNKGSLLRTTSGTFELSRPGRFNWDYLKPHKKLIVSNGKKIWIYDKDLAQVTVSPLSKRFGQAPIMLLGGNVPLEHTFELSNDGSREGLNWVKLIPKHGRHIQFNQILLGLRRGLVQRMVLFDEFGHRTVIEFKKMSVNPEIKTTEFNFTPPPHVDVVRGMK